ncbi:LysE family translocator [Saccharopolyspora sp. NPDC002376]
MVAAVRLLAFAAGPFLLIVIPGPSVLFVVGRALAQGRRAALTTVVGNTLGAYVLVVAVAFGVGALVERSALKLVGAAYLVYLGIKAIRQRRALHASFTSGGPSAHGGLRTLWDGFAVGVANPKTMVFCSSPSCCPSSLTAIRGHVAVQMLLLGLIFKVLAVVSEAVWGLAAATARNWFASSPQRLAAVGGVGGLAMIGLGVSIAVTGRKD